VLLICVLALLAVVRIWGWQVEQRNLTSSWHGEPIARVFYEEGKQGEILLPALADGVDVGPCYLDSGAEAKLMMITPAAARRAKLAISPLLPWSVVHGSMGGSSGLVSTRTAAEFRVGPISLRWPTIAVLHEMHDWTSRSSGEPIGSMCSAAIFHAAVVDIDWRAGQLSFYRPGDTPANLKGLAWIPLIEIGSRPYMKIRFDGGHEGLFLIDTGSNATIHFNRRAVEEFDLLAGRVSITGESRGIGGSGTVRARWMHGLQFGQHQTGQIVASFDTEHLNGSRRASGRIGRGLLRQYRTIIDLPNKRAAFVAYEQSD
jgi:hypothetical protein